MYFHLLQLLSTSKYWRVPNLKQAALLRCDAPGIGSLHQLNCLVSLFLWTLVYPPNLSLYYEDLSRWLTIYILTFTLTSNFEIIKIFLLFKQSLFWFYRIFNKVCKILATSTALKCYTDLKRRILIFKRTSAAKIFMRVMLSCINQKRTSFEIVINMSGELRKELISIDFKR